MQLHTTPGLRAARAAGRYLRTKEDGNLDPILKALEENNRVALERFKSIEDATGNANKRLDDVERKANRAGLFGGGAPQVPSWGQEFVSSPELKAFAQDRSQPGRIRLQVKATMTTADNSGGSLTRPTRDALVSIPRRRLAVRDLLPVIPVSTNSVEYPRQTARTNNAATVAEGALKPESAYAFDMATVKTCVIAHWIPASIQVLDDTPQLAGLIDSELRYGLALVEDAQMLYGTGTGQDLTGMMLSATAFAAPIVLDDASMMDTLALAILQTGLADLPADGIVVHPSDWTRMRLAKDANGNYLLGDPAAEIEPRLFGLPVVPTTSIVAGNFLVGNFQAAATVYDRWEARVEASTSHADFFSRNLVAIRAEERLALAIKQPLALVKGAFPN